MTRASEVTVRLLFVDDGAYHYEEISVEEGLLATYDRLIDVLREEPAVLNRIHIDLGRLCSAQIVEAS